MAYLWIDENMEIIFSWTIGLYLISFNIIVHMQTFALVSNGDYHFEVEFLPEIIYEQMFTNIICIVFWVIMLI